MKRGEKCFEVWIGISGSFARRVATIYYWTCIGFQDWILQKSIYITSSTQHREKNQTGWDVLKGLLKVRCTLCWHLKQTPVASLKLLHKTNEWNYTEGWIDVAYYSMKVDKLWDGQLWAKTAGSKNPVGWEGLGDWVKRVSRVGWHSTDSKNKGWKGVVRLVIRWFELVSYLARFRVR